MAFDQLRGALDNMDTGFEAVVSPSGESGSGGGLFSRREPSAEGAVSPQQDRSMFMSPAGGNRSGIGGRDTYHSLFRTELASDVCGRRIGTSGKFCTRPCAGGLGACEEVKSHSKAKRQPINDATWYVIDEGSAGPSSSAFVTPSLAISSVPRECHHLINDSRRGMTKWTLLFKSLGSASDADQVVAVIDEVDKKVSFKASPEKRAVETIFDETLETELLEEDKNTWLGPYVTPKKMRREAEFYAEQFASKNQQERFSDILEGWPNVRSAVEKVKVLLPGMEAQISDAQRKVNEVNAEIGERPSFEHMSSSTLWGAVSALPVEEGDIRTVLAHLQLRLDASELAAKQARMESEQARSELSEARAEAKQLTDYLTQTLPQKLQKFQDNVKTHVMGRHGSAGSPSTSTIIPSDVGERLNKMEVSLVNHAQKLLNVASRVEGETVQIGTYQFKSLHETTAWTALHIPDGDVCFMVDAISTLELMSLDKGTFMGNLDVATKVGKTQYNSPVEAAVVESFSIEVPSVLLDQSGQKQTDTFEGKALKLLSKYADWTEEDMINGVSYRISEFIEAFEEKTSSGLEIRFGGNQSHKAFGLLEQLARLSVDFLRRFVHWVNTFYLESARVSGNPSESWKLTVDIIQGMCKELKIKRMVAGNLVTTWQANKTAGAGQVLWATLRAHKVMKEFMAYNFIGHPRLATYVLKNLSKNMMTRTSYAKEKEVMTKSIGDAFTKAKTALSRADAAVTASGKK